ncbi:MATE family efflux transporter [Vibrio sp. 10N.286.49.B3]|uniref:MATE family efflux transporter n=1 Tax=Vibrio sp. 10N.286.49.B3 TaxID=1880855 RepID=UPI000C836D89|nr:MATE family efflux transporter [Vibrio sp. 10N.286.49.B3]PMH41167.1 MATE family efflux transporter [Vibrio sp. 10N.286.49.B3]
MPNSNSSLNKRMNIVALTWPIFIEILLRTALNTSDVFMLSGYSDAAVSAVGVISQLSFFLIIMSTMVSSGTGILISQYNGAERYREASHVGIASTFLALGIGLLLSLLAIIAANYFLPLYGLEPEVEAFGYSYLFISGAFTFNLTLGIVFSTILRSHGYSRSPMVINLIAGVINLFGNYCALYQPFGLPVYGVPGVAIATVFSQIVATLLLWITLRSHNVELPFKQFRQIPRLIYKKIMQIGVMNAGEVLFYNLAQIAITFFVVKMGTASLAAFTYAQNIARLSFAFALSLGQASQIQTAYYIGKGWSEQILRKVQWYFVIGFIASTSLTCLIYFFRFPIINLFTQEPEIVSLVALLITGSILLEAGRVFNLIFISALKATGDIKFPIQIGILSMWGIGVTFSYLWGIHWGYGLIGVWLAIAADEWLRGLIMARRWRKKEWVRFNLTI